MKNRTLLTVIFATSLLFTGCELLDNNGDDDITENTDSVILDELLTSPAPDIPDEIVGSPAPDFPVKLLKTGQTTSYADYDDGYYKKGVARNYSRSDDGVVTDHVTELEWQDNVDSIKKPWITQTSWDAGEHNNTSGDTAMTYCQNLALEGNSWRVPSIEELETLVDYGNDEPALTLDVFQYISSNFYWSSTTTANDSLYANELSFENGEGRFKRKTADIYVRCVRGKPLTAANLTRNSETKVVSDSTTDLQWQDDQLAENIVWPEAIEKCESLTLAGHEDWRVPNQKELLSIRDSSRSNPAIDNTVFANGLTGQCSWSSTSRNKDAAGKWVVFIKNGLADTIFEYDEICNVRCVRGE